MFFVCLSRFRFGIRPTKFVITETLWSSVIFKTIMMSLHRGRFIVVHLYPTFLSAPEFFLRGKFIPKITIFRDFGGCKPTYLKPQRWNLAWGCGSGTPFPKPNFVKKNRISGIPLLGKFIPKKSILAILGAVGPHFLSHNGEIWHRVRTLDSLSQAEFGKNSLRGYTPFGKIIPKISNFGYFGG